jgi:serine protease Do
MTFPARTLALLLLLVPGLACAANGNTTTAASIRSDAVLAVYMPPSDLTARSYNSTYNVWIEPGLALDDSLTRVGKIYFPNMLRVDFNSANTYGLLLDLNPTWEAKSGKVQLTLQYNVFGPDGAKLHEGRMVSLVPVKGTGITAAAFTAARSTIQSAMNDTLARLHPDPTTFPAIGVMSKIKREPLVDHGKPLRTGTGFFINAKGQLLTAAHVQRDCVLLEARKDGKTFPVTSIASSVLLDVAVIDSGLPTTTMLPLRRAQGLVLGESVTSVGYPLQGLLADSPNLTRGNVSSTSGIKGSYGMFQFSAPIQPGNSGGPVVSDNGELLGMAVGTLNAKALVEKGLLPQNVNFALSSDYVARFLRRERVEFNEVERKTPGEMKIANDAALGATVQLACFE